MNAMLTDEALAEALALAGESMPDPVADGDLRNELAGVEVVRPWWQRRGPQLLAAAAALIVAALLVQSLSSPLAHRQQVTDASGGAVVRAPAALGDSLASEKAPIASPQEPGSLDGSGAPATTSAVTAGAAGVAGPSNAADSARVVQTGSITVVVGKGKVTAAVVRLQQLVKNARGYVSDSQTQESGDTPSATVTLRVPVGAFDGLLRELRRGLGGKVVNSETSAKDVTADYADTVAQIKTLQAARGRYLTILTGAKTIGEVLTVQQKIDDVQGQIDRLEGSRRVLANQSDLATLAVTVTEKDTSTQLSPEPTGFAKAWADARHGFSSGVQSLIAHSGRALLVLLVAIALLFVGRLGWRLARRRLL